VGSRGRSNTILHTSGKVRTNDASGFLALLFKGLHGASNFEVGQALVRKSVKSMLEVNLGGVEV